jgi:hypothetical protein
MSLNKTLDRLFDEIRREAKRNPDFADRLDAVLRLHDSRRDVADEVVEDVARDESDAPVAAHPPEPAPAAPIEAPALNPAGFYKRKGEDALTEALIALDLSSLKALVEEHNLDPSGVAGDLDAAELVTHIVAQAKKRAERDDKMFDY